MKKSLCLLVLLLIVMNSITIAQSATEYNELPYEDTDYLLENEYFWYRFWFTKGQRIVATLDVPSTADMDLYIQNDSTLDDSNGDGYYNDEREPDLFAASDSSTFGEDERIQWECPSTGEFFVIVSAYQGDGTYTLRVREEVGGIGRGVLIGVVVGAVILIVVLFLVFLRTRKGKEEIPRPSPPPVSPQVPVAGLRYCPVCGSKNSSDSEFCGSCGARLS